MSVQFIMSCLKGWHPGELALQRKMNWADEVADAYEVTSSNLSPQHRDFHTRHISFLPLAMKDGDGRVWTSFLCGHGGQPDFISSPSDTLLLVQATTWPGDPARRILKPTDVEDKTALLAGVGVELTTRRRNKLAGYVAGVKVDGNDLVLGIRINQALGNCPKYIAVRDLVPSSTTPSLISENLNMTSSDVLPRDVIDFVQSQDSLYFSTSYAAPASSAADFPSHFGCNHRGGKPGFVRVTADGRTLVLPDYRHGSFHLEHDPLLITVPEPNSGNRFFQSLGNIETDPSVGLVFPSFKSGAILYLTGIGENFIGPEALAIMPRTRVLTQITITGYTFVRDALPFREDSTTYQPSPYSPPIRYLVADEQQVEKRDEIAVLVDSKIHGSNKDLATFVFETDGPFKWTPGQYVVLEAIDPDEIGYNHMAGKGDESIVNEDGVRTWTISAAPTSSASRTFSITVRRIGRATRKLFALADYFDSPGAYRNRRIEFPVLGIGGTFILPPSPGKTIWIAGGIGVTPFLSFLEALSKGVVGQAQGQTQAWGVEMFLSTREPDVLYELVLAALNTKSKQETSPFDLTLHIFSRSEKLHSLLSSDRLRLILHPERLTRAAFSHVGKDVASVYVCGPKQFEDEAIQGLVQAGISEGLVVRENFDY